VSRETAEQIFVEFRKVIASVILFNADVAQQTGMSMSESQFIHLLELYGSMTPSDLAERSKLTSGTVTGVIDRLEALEFVHRERHPNDRRKVVVVLESAKVAEQLAPLFGEKATAMEAVIATFSDAEQRTIARFLSRLNDAGD
jgi:DNA-binding MarR family transcriptional regulator